MKHATKTSIILAISVLSLWSYIGFKLNNYFTPHTTENYELEAVDDSTCVEFIIQSSFMSPFYSPETISNNEIKQIKEAVKEAINTIIDGRYIGTIKHNRELSYLIEINGLYYCLKDNGNVQSECKFLHSVNNDTILLLYKSDTVKLWKESEFMHSRCQQL